MYGMDIATIAVTKDGGCLPQTFHAFVPWFFEEVAA